VWVTVDNSNYDSGNSTITDASGYVTRFFDPSCAYLPGSQKWKVGVTNDACYQPTNTSPFTFSITSQLKARIRVPDYNASFTAPENVTIEANITDECSVPRNVSLATIELRSPTGAFEPCTVQNNSNGNYSCNWNTFLHQGGQWGVRLNASETSHYSNSTLYSGWINLINSPPGLSNSNVSPSSGGWSTIYNYSIGVNDPQTDNVTCKLFVSTNAGANWAYKGQDLVVGGVGTCRVNVTDFSCSDIGNDNLYIFQLYDGTNTFNTTANASANITANAVTIFYSTGNESSVNRSGSNSTPFSVRVYNNDNSSFVPSQVNASFWVTFDGAAFTRTDTQTNASGFATRAFDPDCSFFAGKQKWTVGVFNDICYQATNATAPGSEYNVSIYGSLSNNIVQPNSDNILRGNDALILGRVEDECTADVDAATISLVSIHNASGTRYSCAPVYDQTGGFYNCTQPTGAMQANWYHVEMNSSKAYFNNASTTAQYKYFIETIPGLSNQAALTTLGGWGETFPFRVTVSDPDADSVTVSLNVRKAGGQWVEVNSTLVNAETPVNVTLSTRGPYGGFSCPNDLGSWEYNFTAVDSRVYRYNTTAEPFSLEKDDVAIQYFGGNNSQIFRNGSTTTRLILYANDTDARQAVFAAENSTVWITTDAATWDAGAVLATNASGHINLDFDPTCSYAVGPQKWSGGIISSQCYKPANSSNYSLTVLGDLRPAILSPNGDGFIRNTPVPITGLLSDDCALVSNATFTYAIRGGSTGQIFTICTNTSSANGSYNCTITPSTTGWWNASLNVSKQYYASNWTHKPNAIFVGYAPALSNAGIDHYAGGWGEQYVFTVRVTDQDLNTNNVSLWMSSDGANWALLENRTVPTPQSTEVKYYRRFSCSEIGARQFKITTVDEFNNTAEAILQNVTFEQDDVALSISPESNSSVRRISNNNALLKFRIFDSDSGNYTNSTNGTIWVTNDGSAYSASYQCSSSNGYCETLHDPACNTSAGVQKWTGAPTDSCYKQVNSSATNLTVYGQLYAPVYSPGQNAIANRGYNFSFSADAIDECSNNVTSAAINWYNETNALLATGRSTNWPVPPRYKLGATTIKTNATRQYYDYYTNTTQMLVYGWATVNYILPLNGSSYLSGAVVEVQCKVSDNNTNSPIANYNVSFYKNAGLQESDGTDAVGIASWFWSTSLESQALYNVSCSISNDASLYYNVSRPSNETFISIQRPLVIGSISYDYATIYRNNSYSPHSTNFTVKVNDAGINASEAATVWLYNATDLLANCTTNSSGICNVVFDEAENATPGVRVLYINASKTGQDSSNTENRSITIQGVLYANITSPANGSFYSKGQSAQFTATVLDENANSPAATMKWYNETSQVASGPSAVISFVNQQTGIRNYSLVASKQYYDDGQQTIQLDIAGYSAVSVTFPGNNSESGFPDQIPITCKVYDAESGIAISNYNASVYYNFSGTFEWLANRSSNSTGHIQYPFAPSQKGVYQFRCTIKDDQPKHYSTQVNSSTITITVKDTKPPVFSNLSIIPSSGLEANYNFTNISVIVTDDTGVQSVWISIGWPNGTITDENMQRAGNSSLYYFVFTPPVGGTYNATINAYDLPPESNYDSSYAGEFQVYGTTTAFLGIQPVSITATGVNQTTGYVIDFAINYTVTGPAPSNYSNLSIYDSSGRVSYNESFKQCGRVLPGQSCLWTVRATAIPATPSQLIRVYTAANWSNPDKTLASQTNSSAVIIASNPVISVVENSVEKTVEHETTQQAGTITVYAAGNDDLFNVNISSLSGNIATQCPGCILSFSPNSQGIISAGANVTVNITVSVPRGQEPGNYWAIVRASSSNAGYDDAVLNITVPTNSTWRRNPADLGNASAGQNQSGQFGEVNVTNDGNVDLDFNIYVSGASPPNVVASADPTAFRLPKLSARTVNASYSATAVAPAGQYAGKFSIRTQNSTTAEQETQFNLVVSDTPPSITQFS
ncbi:MAG: hypothetical protein WC654_05570, partial [Patescibacteria group bacterium]